ncbi:MAG TPA: DUF6662 family protein [Burkholderiaceae bacterium]|nr:DUF6662 family protein [Burkholderiaceae bacterium]
MNTIKRICAAVAFGSLASISIVAPTTAHADENYFGYVYGAETLPAGGLELYQWVTRRANKGQGHYTAYDFETELEYGVTDRFQVSGYLMFERYDIAGLQDRGFEDTQRDFVFSGAKASMKYNFLSPYKDPFGFAVYFEPGFKRYEKVPGTKVNEQFVEFKAIAQKNFLNDQLVTAYNATLEFARRQDRGVADAEVGSEVEWEQTLGASYRVASNWFAGIEGRMHSEWPEGRKEHQAYFLGPNVHYGGKRWWFTLTWLPQISGKPRDDRSDRLHFSEHEKAEWRLKVGYHF